jgi:acyl carrier protein
VGVEDAVREVFHKVLDIQPDEIQPDAKLEESLEVDSTEMVEISVGVKKALNITLADNELKKSHSFNEIVNILKSKSV